ncbi:hypothetical protein ACFQ0M_26440 [Kitasatospora aburaviensis]
MTVVRTSVQPPYAAHLRVYEPLAAYPEAERVRWQAYAAEHGPDAAEAGRPVAAAALEEQRAALAELVGRTPRPLPERESERAFVRALDGVLYVCPWATRLRSWQALEELEGPPRWRWWTPRCRRPPGRPRRRTGSAGGRSTRTRGRGS